MSGIFFVLDVKGLDRKKSRKGEHGDFCFGAYVFNRGLPDGRVGGILINDRFWEAWYIVGWLRPRPGGGP